MNVNFWNIPHLCSVGGRKNYASCNCACQTLTGFVPMSLGEQKAAQSRSIKHVCVQENFAMKRPSKWAEARLHGVASEQLFLFSHVSQNLVLLTSCTELVKVKMLLEESEQALTMKAETYEAGQNLLGNKEDDNKSCCITEVVGGS